MAVPGQFAVSPTGAASYSVPIAVPPGTAGMAPAVSLNYSSQNRDGIVGWGWSLGYGPNSGRQDPRASGRQPGSTRAGFENTDNNGGQSYSPASAGGALSGGGSGDTGMITRCPQTVAQDGVHGGVNYDLNDRFCLNGQRLVLVSGSYGYNSSEYRTEIDGFAKIIAHGQVGNSWGWFEVRTKTGQRLEFGNTTDSQVNATGLSTSRAWGLNKASDTKGNYLTVTYTQDTANAQIYPHFIDYTGNGATAPYNRVEFVYTSRADQPPYYQAGILQKLTLHLSEIKTLQGGSLVLDYKLAYREGTDVVHSRLTSVTLCDATTTTCLPATTFTWQGGNSTVNFTAAPLATPDLLSSTMLVGDYDGDGLIDVAQGATLLPPSCYRGTASGVLAAAGGGFPCPPVGGNILGVPRYRVADFNGDGLADLIDSFNLYPGGYHALINTGSSFTSVATPWQGAAYYGGDYDGDGRGDIFTDVTESGSGGTQLWLGGAGGTFSAGTTPFIAAYYPSAADFDGDGCSDVMWGDRGTIPATPSLNITYFCRASPVTSTLGVTFQQTSVVGDVNGDGKADIVVGCASPCTTSTLYLSTGTGFVSTGFDITPLGGASLFGSAPGGRFFADVNGDGKTDLVSCAMSGGSWPHLTNNVAVFLSTGSGFVAAGLYSMGDGVLCGAAADWNGDGAADFMALSSDTPVAAHFSDAAPEEIVSISNGIGATTNVAYDRLNKNGTFYAKGSGAVYPVQDIDNSMPVVSEVDASNGLGPCVPPSTTNCYVTKYSYAGAKTDLSGRGFLGFTSVTATDQMTGLVQTTTYRTDFPYVGQVAAQTLTTGSNAMYTRNGCIAGTLLKSVANTYNAVTPTVPATPLFVSLQTSVASGHDCDGSALPETTTAYTYDAYGNPTQVSATVRMGGVTSSTSVVNNAFANDTANWLFLLTSTTVTNTLGASTITRRTDYDYATGTNLLTKETVEPGSATLERVTLYGLDSATGVVLTASVSGANATTPRVTHFEYDSLSRFVTKVTNAAGQIDLYAYEARFGGVTNHTDPNGASTTVSYDGFGRTTLTVRPDLTRTALAYLNYGATCTSSCLPGAQTATIVSVYAPDGVTRIAPTHAGYFDALGREIFGWVQGFDGTLVQTATEYDAAGHVARTSRPYLRVGAAYPYGTPAWTAFTYDDLGRAIGTDMPVTSDGVAGTGHATALYHGLLSVQTNAAGQTTTIMLNPQGLKASVTDALGLGHASTYTYDSFGNIVKVTDPLGNETSNSYDGRGNRTGSTDSDMGHWSYIYDGLGELTSQTDAAGQTTTLSYDALGRVVHRVEPGMDATFAYDTAAHGLGLLAQASYAPTTALPGGFHRTMSYDTLGRPVRTDIIASSFAYVTAYNASNGQIDTVTYPSGFVAKYVYNSYGYLSQIKDNATGAVVFTVNARDAELHLLQSTAGNGVVTTNAFDPGTGLPTNIRSGPSDSVAAFDYRYDTLGSLTYRSDNLNGLFERFCYDPLNRLTKAALAVGSDPGTSCASGAVKTVAYDAIGDITSKSDVGAYSYNVSGPGSVRPHAVASITGTVNGVTNPTYTYDLNGNVTANAGRTFTYTAFNMANSITQGAVTTTFLYDADHNRLRMSVPGGAMLYFNDPVSGTMSELASLSTGNTWHDYIRVDGNLVAERFCTGGVPCSATPSWRYYVTDHLGSVAVATDGAGAVVERDAYDPWGKRRNPITGADDPACSLASATTRGFTGHEHIDAQCLINANARIYDETVGRFLTPDDVVADVYDDQGLNRYSYVNNRPLTLTDPSGHMPLGAPGMGGGPFVFSGDMRASLSDPTVAIAGSLPDGAVLAGLRIAVDSDAIMTPGSGPSYSGADRGGEARHYLINPQMHGGREHTRAEMEGSLKTVIDRLKLHGVDVDASITLDPRHVYIKGDTLVDAGSWGGVMVASLNGYPVPAAETIPGGWFKKDRIIIYANAFNDVTIPELNLGHIGALDYLGFVVAHEYGHIRRSQGGGGCGSDENCADNYALSHYHWGNGAR